jgi:hypothetical protein
VTVFDVLRYPVDDIFNFDQIGAIPEEIVRPWVEDALSIFGKPSLEEAKQCIGGSRALLSILLRAVLASETAKMMVEGAGWGKPDGKWPALRQHLLQDLQKRLRDA